MYKGTPHCPACLFLQNHCILAIIKDTQHRNYIIIIGDFPLLFMAKVKTRPRSSYESQPD